MAFPMATTTMASMPSSSTASTDMPSISDSYGTGTPNSSNDNGTGGSLVDYYFIFLAFILCIAFFCAFLIWKRRQRSMVAARLGREDALARDLLPWRETVRTNDARVRGGGVSYWHGRFRSQESVARDEEGLNELGEAPPAYAPPKTREEAERDREQGTGLAVPMQTLSREDAGLKPPDYTESHARAVGDLPRSSEGGEGSSRDGEQSTEGARRTDER